MQIKVLKTIEENGLLSRGDRCILAVSGGADSMALLYVLSSLKDRLAIDLRAVHVHHGLRGAEADRDAEWVKLNCDKLGIACEVRYVDVKSYVRETGYSVEEAARILRYRKLRDAAAMWDSETVQGVCSGNAADTGGAQTECGCMPQPPQPQRAPAKIAVAHNLQDDAETILMQMSRGSGLKGLGGIRERNGQIIRPLLHIKRCEIEEYLTNLGVSWVTDSTNLDDEYTRNRIRHRVLPELESGVNSAAAEHIAQAGRLISQAYDYICVDAEKLIDKYAGVYEDGAGTVSAQSHPACRFPVEVLMSQPPIMRSTVIMLLLGRVCGTSKDISAVHIEDAVSLIDKENGKYIMLPYGLRARREYGDIILEKDGGACGLKEEKDGSAGGSQEPGQHFTMRVFSYSGEPVPTGEYTKWFDYDKINTSVVFRCRKPGDYIALGKTGRKSVASYMTDRKIPNNERDRIMLAADGDHIMWIVGYRISEAYKVTETTVNVLEIICNVGL
jgi:tRNA(Ile)-lysidine synthase